MKQYRYILNRNLSLEGMIQEIQQLPEYKAGVKALLQIVEPNCVPGPIQEDLNLIHAKLPGVRVIGMTSHGALSRETHSI